MKHYEQLNSKEAVQNREKLEEWRKSQEKIGENKREEDIWAA